MRMTIPKSFRPENPLFRYLAPFILFMVLTECQRWGSLTGIFWIYALKTVLVGGLLFYCFRQYRHEIKGSFDGLAVLLGLVVLVLWIVPAKLWHPASDITFDPDFFASTTTRWTAIFFRVLGAALVVPIMEELIWRSFLMRYLIKKEFTEVPLGSYTHLSFWGTVVAFMLVHRMWEWPMAAITGILYGLYIVKRKNLVGCIIAHATTNLGLAIYVLVTKDWQFW